MTCLGGAEEEGARHTRRDVEHGARNFFFCRATRCAFERGPLSPRRPARCRRSGLKEEEEEGELLWARRAPMDRSIAGCSVMEDRERDGLRVCIVRVLGGLGPALAFLS